MKMHNKNLSNATVRIEVCRKYHTRFQRFNMKKDNKNYLYLFYMKMIIIGGIELNRVY